MAYYTCVSFVWPGADEDEAAGNRQDQPLTKLAKFEHNPLCVVTRQCIDPDPPMYKLSSLGYFFMKEIVKTTYSKVGLI